MRQRNPKHLNLWHAGICALLLTVAPLSVSAAQRVVLIEEMTGVT